MITTELTKIQFENHEKEMKQHTKPLFFVSIAHNGAKLLSTHDRYRQQLGIELGMPPKTKDGCIALWLLF